MAIDKSMINQFDDQLQSADYNNNLRNCPTPLLGDLIGNDLLLESMGTFDSLEEIMSSYPSMELQLLAEGNNSPLTGMLSQTAMSNQFTAIMPSSNVHQSSNYAELQPSTSYLNSNSPFSFINESNTFKTIQPESSFHEDSKTPIIGDSGNTMMRKTVNKEKCMTRNAVLARQNREKKKHEHHGLIKKVEQLEEENASLKKKYHDLRESYQNIQERNTYLEAVIQNLPEIVTMVEHMHKFPGNNTNVGSKN